MSLEDTIVQLFFSVIEAIALVGAFIIGYVLIDFIKDINTSSQACTIMSFILVFIVALIIFLPIHFTIGV